MDHPTPEETERNGANVFMFSDSAFLSCYPAVDQSRLRHDGAPQAGMRQECHLYTFCHLLMDWPWPRQ